MANAYIVGAVRTPGGKRDGKLSKIHPTDLGAAVLDELVLRTNIDSSFDFTGLTHFFGN